MCGITDKKGINMKKDLKHRMVNMAPKALFGLAVALTLISCDAEPSPSDLAYMSPSERYGYETYGFVPDDITEKAQAKQRATALLILGLGSAVGAGWVIGSKNKKSR